MGERIILVDRLPAACDLHSRLMRVRPPGEARAPPVEATAAVPAPVLCGMLVALWVPGGRRAGGLSAARSSARLVRAAFRGGQ